MSKPTLDQFRSYLAEELRRRHADAVRNVDGVLARHNAQGRLYSGATVRVIHRETHERFEEGLMAALAILKRAEQTSGLDSAELWNATEEELRDFSNTMKRTTTPLALAHQYDGRRELIVLGNQFDRTLQLKLQHFKVGLIDPAPKEAASMSVNIGRDMIGGGIQQGSPGASQGISFNAGEVATAIADFATVLSSSGVPAKDRSSIEGDLAWIKAQLNKPDPDVGLIRQIGRSARTVVESVTATGVAAALAGPAVVLWAALGL